MTKMESATFKTESDYIKQARKGKLRSGHIQITPVVINKALAQAVAKVERKEDE